MAEPEPRTLERVSPTILVVDDEKNIRRTLDLILSGEGYSVVTVESAEEALERLTVRPIDLAIVDLKLPGVSGLELLARLRADEPTKDLPVVVISGHATVQDAVAAIKLGATDFFDKPLDRDRVLISVRNSLRTARLSRTVEQMQAEIQARYEMIGTSARINKLYQDIDKVAPTKASVLITGESGTGKELVSRAIHRLSSRAEAPFVKVNCAAIPRELIESELFGHEKGSFTGAQGRKRGFFEQAHGGTLFLDEIGDMDLAAQAKVLRALQNGEIVRVGSETVLHVDVRVLAATNKDLSKSVADGTFREDLYFRLDVFPISVPALRERREDIPLMVEAFVAAFCELNGLRRKRIDPAVHEALAHRHWPGNVRELKNVVERAAILSSDVITVADLPEDPHSNPFEEDDEVTAPLLSSVFPPAFEREGRRPTLKEYRDSAERSYILDVLQELDWNISKAAIALGVERTNLHKKIRAYGIKREAS